MPKVTYLLSDQKLKPHLCDSHHMSCNTAQAFRKHLHKQLLAQEKTKERTLYSRTGVTPAIPQIFPFFCLARFSYILYMPTFQGYCQLETWQSHVCPWCCPRNTSPSSQRAWDVINTKVSLEFPGIPHQ